ncbi:MAG TPA: hypothetical protein VM184_02235 [Gaiellaceae bacterium]|nr:hypothetical protein [Gaiellaceae bacterium]
MLGHDDDYLGLLERAHLAYLDSGETLSAVRCAFWVGTHSALRGEMAQATGWLRRAHRLVESEGDCVERGYLLVPVMIGQDAAGDYEAAGATATEAAGIAERFGEADLFALAVHEHGCVLIKQGQIEDGTALLDEAMVAVVAGELSPIVTGMVYCSVIARCEEAFELGRAQEWTAALTAWCSEQPDVVAFTGRCLVHRAEIMRRQGAWEDALEEARRAAERQGMSTAGVARAFYQQGEIHRQRGDFAAAERAFRDASQSGGEPQPGLALLRLAQGKGDAAAAAIRRVLGETTDPLKRAALLPAYVEIMLAVGEQAEVGDAIRELEQTARGRGGLLEALLAHARGAVQLAGGETWTALVSLRHACRLWHDLDAPYEAARARVLMALACQALGDEDTAEMELEAARSAFARSWGRPRTSPASISLPCDTGVTRRTD